MGRRISWRAWLGLILFLLLSYFQYPGHIYLESDTQIYVPMLERLRHPALYERDPMVVRSHTAFTLYDELALGLARVTWPDLEAVFAILQIAARLSLLAGIFLITRAMGLSELLAVACAGIYALGGRVLGPSVLLVEYEPVPRALALGPAVLGIGLAANGRYLAAGAAGAAAFLLHATTAAPFWIVYAALLFVPDEPEEMKARLWGLAPLGAAVLALKAAAGMQAGVIEPQAFLATIDEAWEKLVRMRASYVYVSMWPRAAFWQYTLMLAVSAAAYWRLRRFVQPALRFFLAGLAGLAVASMPVSYLLLEKLKWSMVPQWQPLRGVLFLQLFTMLLALVLAFELACRERRMIAAGLWAAVGLAAGLQPRLLVALAPAAVAWLAESRLRWWGSAAAVAVVWWRPLGLVRSELILPLALAAALVIAAARWDRAVPAAVVAAFFLIPGGARWHWSGERTHPELTDLSRWAHQTTDLNAVFLFADAGRGALDPGVFRARAQRALYVDWKGGGQINFFREYSRLWWSRWQQAMGEPLARERLARFRELGIDYVVVTRNNRLPSRPAVFENRQYLVYSVQE